MLYTVGWSDNYPNRQLIGTPTAYLTYLVWTFYNQPSASAHRLSYDAALVLIILVCALITLARVVVTLSRHRE